MSKLFFIVSLCFLACSLDNNPSGKCRIKEVITSYDTYKYHYKNDSLVSITAKDYDLQYYYTKDGKIKYYTLANFRATYEYDQDGRLTGIKDCYGVGESMRFRYDSNGNIVEQYNIGNDTLQQHIYTYDKGLPVKIRYKYKGKLNPAETHLIYDNKPNPFINLGPMQNPLDTRYGYPVGNCKHNLVKSIVKDIATGKALDTLTWKIDYNGNGYPKSIRGDGSFTFEDGEFIYDCN
jgi:hypothetical protein